MVLLDVMICLLVLARTGRANSIRQCASFLLPHFYYHVDISRGALAKLARYDRVVLHPGLLRHKRLCAVRLLTFFANGEL
jgi:hypothetical protein